MKILVTGGAGFIGSHLVDKFLEENEVVIIDDLSKGVKENVNSKATFYQVDIRNFNKMKEIISNERPEIISHHAAANNLTKSFENPQWDAEINVIGTLNIIKAAIDSDVKKIIYACSGGTSYGEPEILPVTEKHKINPAGPYGLTKYLGEQYLQYYSDQIEFTSLRYASVYGPRQKPENEVGVISIFIDKLLNGNQPVLNGDGLQTRDFVYVRDIVNANLLSLNKAKNQIMNIGTSTETSIKELLEKIQEIIGTNIEPSFGENPQGDLKRCSLDYSKAYKELNWKPEYNLEEGLRKTILAMK